MQLIKKIVTLEAFNFLIAIVSIKDCNINFNSNFNFNIIFDNKLKILKKKSSVGYVVSSFSSISKSNHLDQKL